MTSRLFSWGYWGWGNATDRLVEAFDAAEKSRGYRPPIFVDCRLRRQGRAKGFVGNAFRDVLRPSRYRWMQDLGNLAIATGSGGIKIKNPVAVAELVDLAVKAADERRRVIFYCACEFPTLDGALACHRRTIADLALAYAKKVGSAISIEEWPGSMPTDALIAVDRKLFSAVMRGRMSVPFADDMLPTFAALPWASTVTIKAEGDDRSAIVTVGPARFSTSSNGKGTWYLPLIEKAEPNMTIEALSRRAEMWRTAHGLNARRAA